MPGQRWALGTKLQRRHPTSLVYEEIKNLQDLEGPERSIDVLDTTNHSSTGGEEEKTPTILRSGNVSGPLLYDASDAVHNALLTDLQTRRIGDWRLVLSDGVNALTFSGFVQSMSYRNPVAGAQQMNFAVAVTGAITKTTV